MPQHHDALRVSEIRIGHETAGRDDDVLSAGERRCGRHHQGLLPPLAGGNLSRPLPHRSEARHRRAHLRDGLRVPPREPGRLDGGPLLLGFVGKPARPPPPPDITPPPAAPPNTIPIADRVERSLWSASPCHANRASKPGLMTSPRWSG